MNEATPQSQPERLDIEAFSSRLRFPEVRVLRALAVGLAVAVRAHGRELDMATLRLRAQLDEIASLTPDQEADLPDGAEDLERRLNSETRARVGGVVSAIRRGSNYSKRLLETAIKRYPLEEAGATGLPIEGELHKRFDTVLERLRGLEEKTDINVDPHGFSMGFGHVTEPLLPVVDLCDSLQERTVRQIRARHRAQQLQAQIPVPVTEADGRTWASGYGWLIACEEDGRFEWSSIISTGLSLEALPVLLKRTLLCSSKEAERFSEQIIKQTLRDPAVRALLAPINDINVLIPEFDPAETGTTSKVKPSPSTPPAPPAYTSRLDAGDLHRLSQLQEQLSGFCRQGVSRFVDHVQLSQQADGFKKDIRSSREFSTSLTKTDWDGLAVLECVSTAHNLAAQHEYNFARDQIRACVRGMYEVVAAKHGIALDSVHPDAVDQLISSRRHQNYLREEVGEHSLDARLLRRLETLHRFTNKTAEEVGALHEMRLVETGITKILNRHAAVLSQNNSPSPSILVPPAASRPVLDLRSSQKGAPEARNADSPLKSV